MRPLSGVVLIVLAALLAYLWATGELARAIDGLTRLVRDPQRAVLERRRKMEERNMEVVIGGGGPETVTG